MIERIDFVFLDIDGTIFENRKLIPSAEQAIWRLHENHVPVALCTGRSVLHTKEVQRHLSIRHGVYFNGGLVKSGDEIIHSTPLESEVVQRIIEFSTENRLPTVFHTDDEAIVLSDVPDADRPILESFDFPPLHNVSADWLRDQAVYQVNMMMEHSWEQLVQNTFPEVLIYRWHDRAVDLQKRGCDKSIGASFLLKHLQLLPENAVHIGDGGNDIGMFKTMGLGIAMGNAPDDVKIHADMITKDVHHDGVYHALIEIGVIDGKKRV